MCLFNSPKGPSAPAPPPPIIDTNSTSNQSFVDASNNAKQKAALAQGQSSTDVTGPLGATTPVASQQKTLLGQ